MVRKISNVACVVEGIKLVSQLVERPEFGALLEEYVAFEPPRQRLCELVFGEHVHGHTEDLVQLLKSSLFGFTEKYDIRYRKTCKTTVTYGTNKKIKQKAITLRPA